MLRRLQGSLNGYKSMIPGSRRTGNSAAMEAAQAEADARRNSVFRSVSAANGAAATAAVTTAAFSAPHQGMTRSSSPAPQTAHVCAEVRAAHGLPWLLTRASGAWRMAHGPLGLLTYCLCLLFPIPQASGLDPADPRLLLVLKVRAPRTRLQQGCV